MSRRAVVLLVLSLLSTACGADALTSAASVDPAPVVAAALAVAGEAAPTVVAGAGAARLVGSDSPGHLEAPELPEVTVPPSTIARLVLVPVATDSVSSAPADPPAAPPPATSTPPPTSAPPPTTPPPTTAPPAAPAPPSQLPNDTATAAQFVADINGLRAGLGIAGLTRSAELDSRALEWARVIAAEGALRHSSIIKSLIAGSWSAAGENLGYGPTESLIFNALAASSTHYANMANSTFTHVGVAVVVVGSTLWTVHIFAA